MTEQVGRFLLHGTEGQNAAVRAMAEKASLIYGDRLAPKVDVIFLPASQMPRRADGGASVGFTESYTKIKLWGKIHAYPASDTFAHEIGHALPMGPEQKTAVIALATPKDGRWNAGGYAADVRESGALAQSRAVLGVFNPPYQRYYIHEILPVNDEKLKAVYLAKPAVIEPDPIPPQPTPGDPAEMQRLIDELTARTELLETLNTVQATKIANAQAALA